MKHIRDRRADFTLEALLAVLAVASKKGRSALAQHQGKKPEVHVVNKHAIHFFFERKRDFPLNVGFEGGIIGTGQLSSAMIRNQPPPIIATVVVFILMFIV